LARESRSSNTRVKQNGEKMKLKTYVILLSIKLLAKSAKHCEIVLKENLGTLLHLRLASYYSA
jgi:hypothetical protein